MGALLLLQLIKHYLDVDRRHAGLLAVDGNLAPFMQGFLKNLREVLVDRSHLPALVGLRHHVDELHRFANAALITLPRRTPLSQGSYL